MTTEQTPLMKTMRCICKPRKKASKWTLIFVVFSLMQHRNPNSHFCCLKPQESFTDTHLFPIPAACSSKKMICDRGMAMQHSYRRQERHRSHRASQQHTKCKRTNLWTIAPTLTQSAQSVCGVHCCLTWFFASLQISRWVLNRATPTSSLAWYNDRKRHGVVICLY